MSGPPQRINEPVLHSLTNILKICAAGNHSYALSGTEMWAWGDNAQNSLGIGSLQEVVRIPQRISLQVSSITGSSSHGFAWNDSEVYGWGSNVNFELGLKQPKHYAITRLEYFQEASEKGFRVLSLAAGESHSLAVIRMSDDKKRLFAWGNGKAHQLTVDSNYIVPYPILCQFEAEVDTVYAKNNYSMAVVSGDLYSWGTDEFGRLGLQIPSKVQKTPKKIAVEKVASVAVGECHAAACLQNGEVWTWGHGLYGQLGIGRLSNQGKALPAEQGPCKILLQMKVVEVACGQRHTLLLTADGVVYSCGSNAHGCLGDSETDKNHLCTTPRKTSLSNIRQVCAGNRHSMALSSTRKVYCWGDNSYGQVGSKDQYSLASESETSIQLAVEPESAQIAHKQLLKEVEGTDEADRRRRIRDWHDRYKFFQQQKAREEKAFMDELATLLRS